MKVLYVDDEPDIREIAEMALSLDPDFAVRTASSAADALSILKEWAPDVALLDVMMPGMDGPTLEAELRRSERYASLPVIFVTARAQRSELQSFSTNGAVGVIAKPFNPMTLAQSVREILR
ncbi:Two-component response regulator [Altererythrobacter epoxidivorans]|uniref:Two-component response regulator n=1 Tax=Altererythrobacter epoxidivorans TaxID=361183 RepID=A0A0M4M5N5_9SPHN|nr:response regulator [Altererythrobacter epoxidivorans]ALE17390.1 Two-component response regulator [Altererythrobacter epoxidivorans]